MSTTLGCGSTNGCKSLSKRVAMTPIRFPNSLKSLPVAESGGESRFAEQIFSTKSAVKCSFQSF